MADHVRIAAWLRIFYSVVGLLGVGFVFLVIGGLATLLAGPVGALLGTFLVVILAIMGISALPGLLAGWGMLYYHPWARILNIVLSFFDLFNCPVGTALGLYSIWVLFHPDAVRLFEQPYPTARSY